jgi:ubiquinone/menaquinone biosynthesis C-methylase UbiE
MSDDAPKLRVQAATKDEEIIRASADDVRAKFEYGHYYDWAEPAMDEQWNAFFKPFLERFPFDFTDTLELAPGHGRNTNKLKDFARHLYLVDYNKTCIDKCRERFGKSIGRCEFTYIINDGVSLQGIEDRSISFIYTWDAMVHFDKLLVRQYMKEFFRVLKPDAYGFVHHSNYGALATNPESPIDKNPAWRSTMSAALFRDYARELGGQVAAQRIIDWGEKDLDCISVIRKI